MMNRVKYLENKQPTIYLLATPIGNLKEINPRFIETLNEVESVLCEDTRVSQKLLNHLGIKKTLIAFHEHNEYDQLNMVLELVEKEKKIALISDAGYPLLSDPGQLLVKKALENDINVVVVNGSNALLPALLSSGFSSIPFTFIGFLPHKSSEALKVLEKYQSYYHTIVMYEAIHRLNKTLVLIHEVFGDIEVSISRELTKLNEEHIYGRVSELINAELELKGELVICLNNVENAKKTEIISDDDIIEMVLELVAENVSRKDAIKQVSKKHGLEKNYVYDLVHNKK